ncbi:MAG: UDP-N-acetylglucosamine 2-epimerase (non-hydrolyzing) [Balneolaceae bacterium]|nr:UDP-N-acetylglucosamine 2-epimerase (non-hydrolyzing) [Balneolaceae bacterium]
MNKKGVKKILLIFGTRPEAIKLAPVYRLLNQHPHFETEVCVTAQHREMLDQVLSFFQITPNYDLNVMKKGQGLVSLSSAILDGLKEVFDQAKPDAVFVQGDTTTSTIAALAAFYSGIKVCHVEAGLRTLNRFSPYPEEINRQVTARLADLHFAPTIAAKNNLLDEGIEPDKIWVTGNTVIDALLQGIELLADYKSPELASLKAQIDPTKNVILVTGHRRESFGDGFKQICLALKKIAQRTDVQIIYPVHLNPKVQEPVYSLLGDEENITLMKPLGYPEFIWLMQQSFLILTDSGGIQEEAPSLGKPVLVMRNHTERTEALEAGTAQLVGTNSGLITQSVNRLLNDDTLYREMSAKENPFGDGSASKQILECLNEKEFSDPK